MKPYRRFTGPFKQVIQGAQSERLPYALFSPLGKSSVALRSMTSSELAESEKRLKPGWKWVQVVFV